MNWLLTTCAAPLMSAFDTREKRIPLGLGSLISVLRAAGHQVFFIDNYLEPSDFLETGFLQKNRIDVFGIYVNTICLPDFRRMVEKAQRLRETGVWQGKIVAGGPHASVAPESIPDFVDHVVIGEGERAVLEICEGSPDRILRPAPIENLDELPSPPWDDFLAMPYDWSFDFIAGRPVINMNTSRGCPFKCSFCSVKSIWGPRYRLFSVDRILEDVDYLVKRHLARGIYFREDNFTARRQRLVEFCEKMIRRGGSLEWMCESRVDSLDRELLSLMRRAGLAGLYLGVESGSQRLLDYLHKGIKVEDIEAVFRDCHGLGINTYASMITGVPSETPLDLELSRELLRRIRPTSSCFNVFVGLPTSPLYSQVLEQQLYTFIDDRGMVYLKGHDQRVNQFYGGVETKKIPYLYRIHFVNSQQRYEQGQRIRGLIEAVKALPGEPANLSYWKNLIRSALPKRLFSGLDPALRWIREKTLLRTRLLSWHRWAAMQAHALWEQREIARVRPAVELTFVVVSAEYNAGRAAVSCLESVHAQDYPRSRIRHLFIDDRSDDETPALIEKWLEDHPGHCVEFIRNEKRRWLCANNWRGFQSAKAGEVVIELNGDDWLPDPGVLKYLNKVYNDPEVWMTYNTFRYYQPGQKGKTSEMGPLPRSVIENLEVRKYFPWTTSHLHSFRAELLSALKEESLRDPKTGEFWDVSVDLATYLPLFELAGGHVRHLWRVMYIYNLRELSWEKMDRSKQVERGARIRDLPPYAPLSVLPSGAPGAFEHNERPITAQESNPHEI